MKFDLLHNFISPVTGRVLSDTDYVLVGDFNGIATPSPILIDIRLELINLRHDVNTIASADFVIGFPNLQLPKAQVLSSLENGFMYNTNGVVTISNDPLNKDLTYQHLWRGDDENKAEEVSTIDYYNMPNLDNGKLITGDSGNRPIVTQLISIDNLPPLEAAEIEGIGAYQVWVGTNEGRPEPSYGLSLELAYLSAKLELAAFIMKDGFSVSFPRAQFLAELEDGIVKKITGGELAHAVVGEDYMGMDLATDKLWVGNAEGKAAQVTTIKIDNLPDLAQGKIHVGNASNRPVESDVLKAKFVIFDASQDDLPNAVSLSSVEDGFLAKSGDTIVAATITYQKLLTGDADRKIIEIDKIPYVNYADLQTDYLLTGNAENRPTEILTIKTKNMPPLASGKMYFGNSDTVPQIIGLQEKYLFTGDSGGNISSVLRLDIDNYVDLTNDYIHVGNSSNRPVERKIADVAATPDAKYILQTSNSDLPNAQALDMLIGTEPKILKASSSGVIQVAIKDEDYATKEKLEEIRDETEEFKNQAEQAKNDAQSSADNAQNSATNASNSASAAESSASAASSSASAASGSASAAAGSASAALSSAAAAAGSASAALASAAEATAAAAGATAAAASALSSSNAAAGSAAAALGSAALAAGSAAAALGSAGAAGASASQASGHATDAETFSEQASGYATNSAASALASAGSATAAAASLAALLATPVVLQGDVSGSGLLADPITTTFIANPTFNGTSYIKIPIGTTAQRPGSPENGMIRFNTDL